MNKIAVAKHRHLQECLNRIEEPQSYGCHVVLYMHSHRQMLIEAAKHAATPEASHSLYIGCEAVQYFEGPMQWQGIDFRLASFDERYELMREDWTNAGPFIHEFAEGHLLLILERPGYRVRLCAGNCEITDSIHPYYMPLLDGSWPHE